MQHEENSHHDSKDLEVENDNGKDIDQELYFVKPQFLLVLGSAKELPKEGIIFEYKQVIIACSINDLSFQLLKT